MEGDLAGSYYPLTGMDEKVRQQLVDDHFLFMSGDPNLKVAGMERDWPEGRGIFHNATKTFLVWVNEEDQLRIISMQKGGDVKGVFERLARGIKAVGDSVKAESGKDFLLSPKFGYIHSCPTNLGTGMRASVHVDLPGWTKDSIDGLKARCEALNLQPRGTRGESGGQTGKTTFLIILIWQQFRTQWCQVVVLSKSVFEIAILFRTHLWHFQQTSSWLLWGPTCPNHDWWCQYPLEGGSWTAKEARNVNSRIPNTSLLQNPYLKLKKIELPPFRFLMSLKMFKKSSKNSKIIFFTTYQKIPHPTHC